MENHSNPLLAPWTGPFGEAPFQSIRTEHYRPAIEMTLEMARQKLKSLREDSSAPNFENTVLALEALSEPLDRASGIFFNLVEAESNDEMRSLAKELSPLVSAFANDLQLDSIIFQKVKALYEAREALALSVEQSRLLEKTYKSFARNGALLKDDSKKRLREIDEELARLGPQYSDHVLKATTSKEFFIFDQKRLEGVPESALEAAREAASSKGKSEAWLFTLDVPSFSPLVTYAKDRALREELWRAYNSRALGGDFDNREVLQRIAVLRHQRATLLGYETHAHYVLEERMAKNPQNVTDFLRRLESFAQPQAKRELEKLQSIAAADGVQDLKPWDVAFYIEKLKQAEFDFDEESLRPYFPLESVLRGVFEHAKRLYGLEFKPNSSIPVYHPDVRGFEVWDGRRFIGLFYADFFPRKSKRGGAWMTAFRDQGLFEGKVQRPHVSIVCNFTPPTSKTPSLLSYDEVRTLFHEFGHALHGLLSECTYRSVAGTNVYWDFVELPSQIMENWTEQKESLDLFAKHYETGEALPDELAHKIKQSSRFMAGWYCMRQLAFARLDMAWHSKDPAPVKDVEGFEKSVLAGTQVLPRIDGTSISTSFSHIFAGGYSAGYYSYKWAEVLDADAFSYFQEHGLFDREVAKKFREHVLSKGGSEHPSVLFERFRGRSPDADALIRRDFG
ncbi:M3 family peptidase [bacterium]|nr:M3 family peptidase [bacterium]